MARCFISSLIETRCWRLIRLEQRHWAGLRCENGSSRSCGKHSPRRVFGPISPPHPRPTTFFYPLSKLLASDMALSDDPFRDPPDFNPAKVISAITALKEVLSAADAELASLSPFPHSLLVEGLPRPNNLNRGSGLDKRGLRSGGSLAHRPPTAQQFEPRRQLGRNPAHSILLALTASMVMPSVKK